MSFEGSLKKSCNSLMTLRNLQLTVMLSIIASNTVAQDPFKAAPGAYKLQFENDWVTVARVHYGPHEKIPAHDHPKSGTVFVYLKDGGPVRFQHLGDIHFPLTRPPVKAGGFRLGPAVKEHHEVENLSDQPSDFLRVELKTDPVDAEAFKGRFPPEPEAADKSFQRVAFENGQVRILRAACAAPQTCDAAGALDAPALIVAFTPLLLNVIQTDGTSSPIQMELGQTQWLEPGQKAQINNRGSAPAGQLRIELKTKPVKAKAT